MKKSTARIAIALSLALSLTLLCACSPRQIDEAQAKRAGLSLLRQAFGVDAQDAHVEYFERAGSCAVDNSETQPGGSIPTRIYIVTISDSTIQEDLYYAEVDAITGVAYYATKNEYLMASAPQQDISTTNSEQADTQENDSLKNDCAKDTACEFVMRCFQREVTLISAQNCCPRESAGFPRACVGYFVTFADGALYRVGFSWPQMDLNEVQVLETDQEGERP